ncbi:MAG: type II toxin-antitoxin system RelE/ParE family toxin [Synergistaceae bacterium]|nr:type II toxin-antitoxin system RelE/ParE family toxin [Synergistaceae bacterium]
MRTLPYSKPLGDGIFELRARSGRDISRVPYFFIVNGCVVLTHGFVKKTQKTPKQELERAKAYRNDYLKRNSET